MCMEEILRIFPLTIRSMLQQYMMHKWTRLQEIRCRVDQGMELIFDHQVVQLDEMIVTREDITSILHKISAYSLYRMEDELREGYITIDGGHRIGLAGEVSVENKQVHALQYITFLNVRIAKEHIDSAQSILPYMYDEQNYKHTLIIGAPKSGKTSLIRDVTRMISNGWQHVPAKKVGLVDERSEIAASHKGMPTLNVGMRTDVLDRCPKVDGMMMLIRSMSPEVLIVDEIGSGADVQAVLEAIHAGVCVICTAHANSINDIKNRPSFQPLFHSHAFQRIVYLESENEPGTIGVVMDSNWKPIKQPRDIGVEQREMDWRNAFY